MTKTNEEATIFLFIQHGLLYNPRLQPGSVNVGKKMDNAFLRNLYECEARSDSKAFQTTEMEKKMHE